MNASIILQIEKLIQDGISWLCLAHDFEHIDRVRKTAIILGNREWKWDIFIIEAGALLHEYLDPKFFIGEELMDWEKYLENILATFGVSSQEIKQILFIVKNVGYGKSLSRAKDFPYTIEMQIVEDADRLDAVWAIAIARTFTYGGKKGRKIYDWKKYELGVNKETYHLQLNPSSIFHFYEKLLLLKDTFHTKIATEIAISRHKFMEAFLEQFYKEWNLEDIRESR